MARHTRKGTGYPRTITFHVPKRTLKSSPKMAAPKMSVKRAAMPKAPAMKQSPKAMR